MEGWSLPHFQGRGHQRRERRLDDKFEGGQRCKSEGGRASRSERGGRTPTRAGEKRCRSTSGPQFQQEGEEKKPRGRRTREEEEEEEAGAHSVQAQEGASPGLRFYRLGPRPKGEEGSASKSSEDLREDVKEGSSRHLFQPEQFNVGFLQQRGSRPRELGERSLVPGGPQSASGRREVPRHFDGRVADGLPGLPDYISGPGMGCLPREASSSSGAILPQSCAAEAFPCHGQRISERGECIGFDAPGPSSGGCRSLGSEIEIFGIDGKRGTLFSCPEDGDDSFRKIDDCLIGGDSGGSKEGKRGGENLAEGGERRLQRRREWNPFFSLWKGSIKRQKQEREERQRRKRTGPEERPEEGRRREVEAEAPLVEGAESDETWRATSESLRKQIERPKALEERGGALESLAAGRKDVFLREDTQGGLAMPESPTNSSFGALGEEVLRHLQHCMSQPTAEGLRNGDSVSVPLARDADASFTYRAWEYAVLLGLQSLSGEETPRASSADKTFSQRLAKSVRVQLERLRMWEEPVAALNFEHFFMAKTIDYRGEQVKLGQSVNWVAVENSLPEGIGRLKLEEFCTLGTKHYVENFEAYIMDTNDMKAIKKPKVMVSEAAWEEVSAGLVRKGLCEVMPLTDVFHVGGSPLLNGMFSVGKGEFINNLESQRLIMNLIPLNSLCGSLEGDVSTPPSLSTMSAFLLEEGEVCLTSSEDVRCFFYLFEVPKEWRKFMGFNKIVPDQLVPTPWKGRECVLVSRVLPMGFVNSVSIAQHVHRNVVRWAAAAQQPEVTGEREIRKDRGFPLAKSVYRVYLDNFDLLEVVDKETACLISGTPSAQVLSLREAYEELGLPRHPKKAVERQLKAEVQGAVVLGDLGIAIPKPAKVVQYVKLSLELLNVGACTLRELQVVCGGLVYMAMFRRPLLCGLNKVWEFMESFKQQPVVVRLPLPAPVKLELARMISLVPLAQLNFSNRLRTEVTCSDASEVGGGICVSKGLTDYGVTAANSEVRGTVPEAHDFIQVLTVGLFDGIGALRVACDLLGVPSGGHISIEKDPEASRVLEAHFADTTFWDDVTTVNEAQVHQWSLRYSNCGLVLIGAGPPCQGVSKLNADRRGALRDHRSCLFAEVERITNLFRKAFPWAQVQQLMESVASMGDEDRIVMSTSVGSHPWLVDSAGIALCHRPRLYWITWQIREAEGVQVVPPATGDNSFAPGQITLVAEVNQAAFLEPGSSLAGERLPTFTTSRPRGQPGRRPAGLERCLPHERERWQSDLFRYPPYQYRDHSGILTSRGAWRSPTVGEREIIMGFPRDYTAPCWPKGQRTAPGYLDKRCSLVGNSWHVGVVAWLLGQLLGPLGLGSSPSPQDIVHHLTPGHGQRLQTLLLRPPLLGGRRIEQADKGLLVRKMLGLVSIKGEDLMIQSGTEPAVKFQRLRAGIPGALWKWKEVAGWAWKTHSDHINVLEMRAILTTVKWLVEKKQVRHSRFLHLTDSLVCLHSLSRGRSSSRKLRRTLMRINALLLGADLHAFWGYIHTSQNPADRPSRRVKYVRKKWVK